MILGFSVQGIRFGVYQLSGAVDDFFDYLLVYLGVSNRVARTGCELVEFIVYRLSFIIYHLSFIIYHLSFIIYHLSFIVYRLSFIVYRLSFIV